MAVRLGYLLGTDADTFPFAGLEVFVNRMSAAWLMTSIFYVPEADTAVLQRFSDYHLIPQEDRAGWAGLVSAGIVKGHDVGLLDPLGVITQGQFSALLLNTVHTVLSAGQHSDLDIQNALINTDGVHIAGATAHTLFVSEGARHGDVLLSDVTAAQMVVRGGGLSIENSQIGEMQVRSYTNTNAVRVRAHNSDIDTVYISSVLATVYLEGQYDNVVVDWTFAPVLIMGAVDELTISGTAAKVMIAEGGSVGTLNITEYSNGFTLVIDGAVNQLNVAADNGIVLGDGVLEHYDIASDGVHIQMTSLPAENIGGTPNNPETGVSRPRPPVPPALNDDDSSDDSSGSDGWTAPPRPPVNPPPDDKNDNDNDNESDNDGETPPVAPPDGNDNDSSNDDAPVNPPNGNDNDESSVDPPPDKNDDESPTDPPDGNDDNEPPTDSNDNDLYPPDNGNNNDNNNDSDNDTPITPPPNTVIRDEDGNIFITDENSIVIPIPPGSPFHHILYNLTEVDQIQTQNGEIIAITMNTPAPFTLVPEFLNHTAPI